MNFWTKPSGTILAELEERKTTSLDLPVELQYIPLQDNNLQLSVLNGNLPSGMRLENYQILGTPYEVELDTVYSFVIRAEQYGHIDDRTYKIVVKGPDDPVWVTPEGNLPVGANDKYFILDSAVIDFQLIAIDPDTIAGDDLEYYIQSGDGELPPGIQLTTDGRLVGIVEPILAIAAEGGSGTYDSNLYGSYPFDFGGSISDNGFDSFFYDTVIYDTFVPTQSPKKLNRFYDFKVSVTDGIEIVKRQFQIYVVGDDFLRADNTIMKIANGVFTADNTHIRTPIWLTPRNFGYRRANNYVTLFLDVLDLDTLTGIITYSLETTNDDGSPSTLPLGLTLDESNGEIAGRVPYQQAVTKEYKFTIRALRRVPNTTEETYKDKTFIVKMLGEIDSTMTWSTPSNLGTINTNYTSTLNLQATTNVPNSILIYNLVSGKLPPGLRLSYDGEIIGKINSFGSADTPGVTTFDSSNTKFDQNTTTIDRSYIFTAKARDHFGYSAIEKTFSIKITDPDDKLYSNIYARPLLKENQRIAYNDLISNKDYFSDEFIYRPNDPSFGIQKKIQMLIYAGIETKTAGHYVSAISKNNKRKKYKLGQIKTAVAKKPGTNTIVYEVVYVEVIDPDQNGINETKKHFNIDNPNKMTVDQTLYNLDPFSVENAKPMGIIIGTNEYGDVEHYFTPYFVIDRRNGEEIYIDINPLVINDRKLVGNLLQGPNEPFRFRPVPDNTMKVDFDGITIDGSQKNKKYISNLTHVRNNIKNVGETEIEFLPLWMRTAQENNINFLGYKPAIPLCFCKPNTSKEILTALNRANVSFQNFNIDVDRFIVDSTEGNSNEQYLVFHNYAHNV